MQKRKQIIHKQQLARILMIGAILLIVLFQGYWISRLYKEERTSLQKETSGIFRDVVYNLQVARFQADTLFYQPATRPSLFTYNAVNAMRRRVSELKKDSTHKKKISIDSTGGVIMVMGGGSSTDSAGAIKRHFTFRGPGVPPEMEAMIKSQNGAVRLRDTTILRRLGQGLGVNVVVRAGSVKTDSAELQRIPVSPVRPSVIAKVQTEKAAGKPNWNVHFDTKHPERSFVRMISDGKALADTIPISKLDSAFKKDLAKAKIPLTFSVRTGKDDSLHRRNLVPSDRFHTEPEFVGFIKPSWYQAEMEDPAALLIKRISPQILFSLFLVAFTSVTFIFLYRNLAAQRRLTEMKNDFISNITHELKTPIATVSVAVEALRNFGGIQSPERTKEYLDISAAELQRLGLLVDKVLKLSLFENRELELKKENIDLKQLTEEVLNTMKLQFEKHHAKLNLEIRGFYFAIHADRLHVTSVIYNLLDNALKYSKAQPEISVALRHETEWITLEVRDKGIGIAPAFKDRIFEKFFRVPTGDQHNVKGYGLGLSYVSHVVKKHGGAISVESEPGKGSTFIVKFPVA
ncbi:MAG: HAMP domain-containing histidine kinase [Chitinophagaceae bacterium]|nr:HAMP domain-containing histidine kinase [Chitinophagaceae bacterium]